MKVLAEVLKLSAEFLQKQGIKRFRREAEEILRYVLQIPRVELYTQHDRPLIEEELEKIRVYLKRRSSKEPLEYLLGEVDFCDHMFTVDARVLIPRVETEILAYQVIQDLKQKNRSCEVFDICCGSGCLGLSIKKHFPLANVTLSDICPKALEVARLNADKLGVKVNILQGDLLKPFQGIKADLVVCNPPYVSLQDYHMLEPEVKNFEPRQALVANDEGFSFYTKLEKQLPEYLRPGAKIYFEIGDGMGQKMFSIYHAHPWKSKRCEKDWSGRERFFYLEFEPESPLI